jgi:hypothetical protein
MFFFVINKVVSKSTFHLLRLLALFHTYADTSLHKEKTDNTNIISLLVRIIRLPEMLTDFRLIFNVKRSPPLLELYFDNLIKIFFYL